MHPKQVVWERIVDRHHMLSEVSVCQCADRHQRILHHGTGANQEVVKSGVQHGRERATHWWGCLGKNISDRGGDPPIDSPLSTRPRFVLARSLLIGRIFHSVAGS